MADMFHERVRNSILDAINTAKDYTPDGRRRSLVVTKLEEALLWLESEEALKDAR